MALRSGGAAFWDTFAGLIPVQIEKITGMSGLGSTRQTVSFRVARTMGPYRAGEAFERSGLWVVPRAAVTRRGSHLGILPYFVQVDG